MGMATQWQVDVNGGRNGLRYEALPVVMAAQRVGKKQRPAVFADVQAMEFTALRVWREAAG